MIQDNDIASLFPLGKEQKHCIIHMQFQISQEGIPQTNQTLAILQAIKEVSKI